MKTLGDYSWLLASVHDTLLEGLERERARYRDKAKK